MGKLGTQQMSARTWLAAQEEEEEGLQLQRHRGFVMIMMMMIQIIIAFVIFTVSLAIKAIINLFPF